MNDDLKEMMLDLLCDKFVYGLSEEEAKQLEGLGYDSTDADSIELTIAALGLIDLPAEAQIPAGLKDKLLLAADQYFEDSRDPGETESAPVREIVLNGGSGGSWFGWLGWATAAAASIALVISLFVPRGSDLRADLPGTPSPTPEVRIDPYQERQRLVESGGKVILAEWGKGNVDEIETIAGDVVWSDEQQAGYMRFRGLPKNDVSKETYQLWIFDETQDPATPIDGGTFDISEDGEVVVPIKAKLRAKNPGAFAITIEKPGGVVVSKREKIATLAPVKPKQV